MLAKNSIVRHRSIQELPCFRTPARSPRASGRAYRAMPQEALNRPTSIRAVKRKPRTLEYEKSQKGSGCSRIWPMEEAERRDEPWKDCTFLLGLIGSLTAATLAPVMAAPSQPLSFAPQTPSEAVEATESAEVSASNLDDVRTEYAQYYRRRARRVYRRYVRRPYRRYARRSRRYWRRGRWYY